MNMNWLDIAFLCLVLAGVVKGWSDGLIRQIVLLIALVVAICFCSVSAIYIGDFIAQSGWFPKKAINVVSHVIAFTLIVTIITIAGSIIHRMIAVTPLNLLNHLAGSIVGLIFTLAIISLTINVFENIDRDIALIPPKSKTESRYYAHIKAFIPMIYPKGLCLWRDCRATDLL